jgi:hypothetical protein
MIGPRAKYLNERDDRYGANVYWPGNQYGIPFRGDAGVPLLRQNEIEALPVVGDFKFKTFDLSDESDAKYYAWVKDRIANLLFRQDFIQRFWNPDTQTMSVYLEWTQFYVQCPGKSGGQNGQGIQYQRSPS